MAIVVLSGYIRVPEQALFQVSKALLLHKKLTLEEKGCIVFKVTPCSSDKCRFDVYEEFVDQQAFEFHQARVKSSVWGQVTKDVIRHYQISTK